MVPFLALSFFFLLKTNINKVEENPSQMEVSPVKKIRQRKIWLYNKPLIKLLANSERDLSCGLAAP